jgi:hypothetical protein
MAVFGLLALVVAWPILAGADLVNVFRDAQVLFAYERDAAWSVLRFGQAPLWDPYYCGGLYLLGTPQSRFVSPTFLFSLLFGPARGEALTIFAMILLGLEGTFRYARARGGGPLGSMLAAPAFALGGVFIAAPFLGWTNFYGFELVPWVMLFVHRAVRGEVRAAAYAALFFAWIVGFGGTYAAPFSAILCLYELAERLLERRQGWRLRGGALGLGVLAAALAVGLGAVRLVTLLETLVASPRALAGRPGMGAWQALGVLLDPVRVSDGELSRPEAMYTLGAGAVALALVGLVRRRVWPLVPLGVVAFVAALGYAAGPWGPFALLKALPVFSALRYPERYLIVIALVAAVAAANGLRFLEVAARRRRWAVVALAGAAGVLGANTAFLVSDFHAVAAARMLEEPPPELARPFQQARGNRWRAAFYAPMSRGSLSCWDAYPIPMSPLLRGDLPADEYLLDAGAGSVSRADWSPNAIELDVSLTRPGTLLINQNFHPGWRSDAGLVRSHEGLLAVDLPAGSRRVALRFRPRSALAGAVTTLAALLAIGALLGFGCRTRFVAGHLPTWRQASLLIAAAAAPLALGALVYATTSEARPVRPPRRAPSGEEVLAPRPPDDATTIAATFGHGIVLEAVRTSDTAELAAGEPASVELDWRTTGAAPRDAEIVVSIESAGDKIRADHELLSAALPFSEAPRGVTLRDIVPFVLPSRATGEVEIWVAIWLQDAGRWLPITAPGSGRAQDGRLLVASIPPPR